MELFTVVPSLILPWSLQYKFSLFFSPCYSPYPLSSLFYLFIHNFYSLLRIKIRLDILGLKNKFMQNSFIWHLEKCNRKSTRLGLSEYLPCATNFATYFEPIILINSIKQPHYIDEESEVLILPLTAIQFQIRRQALLPREYQKQLEHFLNKFSGLSTDLWYQNSQGGLQESV